jgi:hypothetical protein
MLALDCCAQKPMSLWRLRPVYVLDSKDIPEFRNWSTMFVRFRVISADTKKNRVRRVWIAGSGFDGLERRPQKIENMSRLNFPKLKEMRLEGFCWIPKDMSAYPKLQVLVWHAPEEECLEFSIDSLGYYAAPDFCFPKQMYELKKLKILELHAPDASIVLTENILKLKKLRRLSVESGHEWGYNAHLHVPVALLDYYVQKKDKLDFGNTEKVEWKRQPIRNIFCRVSPQKSYEYEKIGNVFVSGHYKNGKPDGEWYIYDTSGKLIQERYYKNGLEEGDWKYWRTYYYGEENEIYEETYNNGVIKSCRHSRDRKTFAQFENMEEPFNKICSRYRYSKDSSFWKSSEIYTNARLYKRTYERQDYSQELIYPRQGYRPDSVIIKHRNIENQGIPRKAQDANYVSEEFFYPYYIKIETKKLNNNFYSQTVYDTYGDIFWKVTGHYYNLWSSERLVNDYINYQADLRYKQNVKKETTVEEIFEPYYLRVEKTTEPKGWYYITITFYDKDGNIYRKWHTNGSPNTIKEIIDEKIRWYMIDKKNWEKK